MTDQKTAAAAAMLDTADTMDFRANNPTLQAAVVMMQERYAMLDAEKMLQDARWIDGWVGGTMQEVVNRFGWLGFKFSDTTDQSTLSINGATKGKMCWHDRVLATVIESVIQSIVNQLSDIAGLVRRADELPDSIKSALRPVMVLTINGKIEQMKKEFTVDSTVEIIEKVKAAGLLTPDSFTR